MIFANHSETGVTNAVVVATNVTKAQATTSVVTAPVPAIAGLTIYHADHSSWMHPGLINLINSIHTLAAYQYRI